MSTRLTALAAAAAATFLTAVISASAADCPDFKPAYTTTVSLYKVNGQCKVKAVDSLDLDGLSIVQWKVANSDCKNGSKVKIAGFKYQNGINLGTNLFKDCRLERKVDPDANNQKARYIVCKVEIYPPKDCSIYKYNIEGEGYQDPMIVIRPPGGSFDCEKCAAECPAGKTIPDDLKLSCEQCREQCPPK